MIEIIKIYEDYLKENNFITNSVETFIDFVSLETTSMEFTLT